MAIHSDSDLDFMLRDAGVPVSLGGASTYGIFRRAGEMIEDGQGGYVPANHRVLTVREGTLPGLAEDVNVTIDGTSYRVRNLLPSPHPRLVRAQVAG
ncbi:MAG TPA: hypothetical protein VIP11_22020 [Gemmatimonadaceae bacterium]